MDKQAQEMQQHVQRFLEQANDELLGMHRYNLLTYEQYSQVANLLVDAQQVVKRFIQGEEGSAEQQEITIPLWIFFDKRLSPIAKWTYAYLLKLHREVKRSGRSSLVINLSLVSKDVFPTYAWTEKHLIDALQELSQASIIASRKMEYPQDTPVHYEIEFLKEENV